jgi:hypothetical protein
MRLFQVTGKLQKSKEKMSTEDLLVKPFTVEKQNMLDVSLLFPTTAQQDDEG